MKQPIRVGSQSSRSLLFKVGPLRATGLVKVLNFKLPDRRPTLPVDVTAASAIISL